MRLLRSLASTIERTTYSMAQSMVQNEESYLTRKTKILARFRMIHRFCRHTLHRHERQAIIGDGDGVVDKNEAPT
jgi:O-methyltransferase involved in polyketide biosynthesis